MDFQAELLTIGKQAKAAARKLAVMDTQAKNKCLSAIAEEIDNQQSVILEANEKDLAAGRKEGLTSALLDRLELTPKRFAGMIQGLHDLQNLPNPVGTVDREFKMYNDLIVRKVRVPIGVIGIIYESRPNVTVDAGGLCLKAGNAVVLRGGREAIHSNRALAKAMAEGGAKAGLDPFAVQLIPWTDREAVNILLKMHDYLNLIIPRGGEGLIRFVTENSTIPVIKHYKGVCHVYVDKAADVDMALKIVDNAKTQRPGVCNAAETVLIHRDIAADFAPRMAKLLQDKGVELRGDGAFCELVPAAKAATPQDWETEYLDLILSVRIVNDIADAIEHIGMYGEHSDAIVSRDKAALDRFLREVDSAAVYANASTRFTDGGEFGMGAEIGISTDRIHARGPMGLQELTTYKYTVVGEGQVRE